MSQIFFTYHRRAAPGWTPNTAPQFMLENEHCWTSPARTEVYGTEPNRHGSCASPVQFLSGWHFDQKLPLLFSLRLRKRNLAVPVSTSPAAPTESAALLLPCLWKVRNSYSPALHSAWQTWCGS